MTKRAEPETLPDREAARLELERVQEEFAEQEREHLNEAGTRLLFIDRILQILGWEPKDFKPETPSGGAGYADYLLTADHVPSLVLEAKRSGKTFKARSSLAKTEYSLSYLRSNFGSAFTDVLLQAERYAKEHGLSSAVISNGDEWLLVQVVPYPGREALDITECVMSPFSALGLRSNEPTVRLPAHPSN